MVRLFGRRKSEIEQRDELISAYLDGELSDTERARFEARLSEDSALRAELRAMHRTVSLVRETPQVMAPRNFVLSESMVRRATPAMQSFPPDVLSETQRFRLPPPLPVERAKGSFTP